MKIETLKDFFDPRKCARLVVKVGSALLVDGAGELRREWIAGVVSELAELRRNEQEIVIVSSGAIALGAARLGLPDGGRGSLADSQASAAVGQIALAGAWAELLSAEGLIAAQLLLTLDDLEGRRRYLNAAATLGRLLKTGAVPVVNENDSIATSEIRFGDNDRLAARVAQACRADAVLLMSDVEGLFDRNPRHPQAALLPKVQGVTSELHAMADGGSASGKGSGGMTSKLLAAEIAERAGISMAIVDGAPGLPIRRALAGDTGTVCLPTRGDSARKAWIGGRIRMNGAIVVDPGCVSALERGKSVLAAGIARIDGTFERGDIVAVHDEGGRMLAKGLVEYDADECRAIMRRQNADHEALLGYAPRSAVIHRDQLVLL
jgi:glutamate 5-kinase